MKRIIVILAALLLSISAFAQNGKSIYQKYSDADNVSAVYVSPAMFRMIGRIPDMSVGEGEVNITPIIRSLTGLYIVNSENPAINDKLHADAERFINSGKYELLMEAKDSGETVRIYTLGNDKLIEGFVLLAAEAGEVTFICLDGQMPRKEFEDLISQQVAE